MSGEGGTGTLRVGTGYEIGIGFECEDSEREESCRRVGNSI